MGFQTRLVLIISKPIDFVKESQPFKQKEVNYVLIDKESVRNMKTHEMDKFY